MKMYKARSKVRNGASTAEVGLDMSHEIIVGKFVERDRPSYLATMDQELSERLGDRYVRAEELTCQ